MKLSKSYKGCLICIICLLIVIGGYFSFIPQNHISGIYLKECSTKAVSNKVVKETVNVLKNTIKVDQKTIAKEKSSNEKSSYQPNEKKETVKTHTNTKNNVAKSTQKTKNSVSNGRTIQFKKIETYHMPETITQGNLSEQQYKLVQKVFEEIKKGKKKIARLSAPISIEDAHDAMDHLSAQLGKEVTYDIETASNGNAVKLNVNLIKLLSGIEALETTEMAYSACMKAGLKNGMSEKEAVKRINDWICRHMTYELNYGDAIVGFNTGKGQCCTYAGMFKEMCEIVGIRCQSVSGYAQGSPNQWEGHEWNRVKIGGTWYYIDVTWNDSLNSKDYYLSQKLWANHIPD